MNSGIVKFLKHLSTQWHVFGLDGVDGYRKSVCVGYWMNSGWSIEGEELIRNLFASDLSALMKCHEDKS